MAVRRAINSQMLIPVRGKSATITLSPQSSDIHITEAIFRQFGIFGARVGDNAFASQNFSC